MIKWNEQEIDAVARQAKTLASIEMLKKIRSQMRTGKSCRIVGLTDLLHTAQEVLPIARRKPAIENQADLLKKIKDRMLAVKVHGINLTTGSVSLPKTKKTKAPKTQSKAQLLAALRNIESQLKAINQAVAAV